MTDKHTFPALMSQCAVACNLTTLYLTMTVSEGAVGRMIPLSLLVYAPLVYLLNCWYLRRERTLRGVALLNFAAAAYVLSCLWVDGRQEPAALAFVLIFVVWLTSKGQSMAQKPPQMSGLLICLDGSIATLVLFSAYTAATGLELKWSIPVLCGTAGILLGVSVRRMDRAPGIREGGVLALAFAGIFGLMWLMLTLVAAPTGHGLVLAWQGLGLLIELIQWCVVWFFRLLASFFSPDAPAAFLPEEEFHFELEQIPEAEANPVLAAVLAIILVAAVAVGVIGLLRYLGTVKLGGRKVGVTAAPRRERPSLLRALKVLLASWREKARLRRFLRKNRSTPVGLYFHLVRKCRMSPWHKRPGETPREFLLRLEDLARNDRELAAAMTSLTEAVDRCLYGGAPAQSLEEASRIRRRVGRVVRRQAFRDAAARLQAVLRGRRDRKEPKQQTAA